MNLSGNDVSKVWVSEDGLWVYKEQPKFLTDNAYWCFTQMYESGYVPRCEKINAETIRTEYIPNTPVLSTAAFLAHYEPVLEALAKAGIRHGDLTSYALRIMDDKPYLIDFAESRLLCDPREDKRPGGDAYWLKRTMEELSNGN